MATSEQLATTAARYWSDLWRATNPAVHEDTLAKFRAALVPAVVRELDGTERLSLPSGVTGKGHCALTVDYDPFEPLLSAVHAAGVECRGCFFSADGIFPRKHRMYIQDGRISVAEGYGAHERYIDLETAK